MKKDITNVSCRRLAASAVICAFLLPGVKVGNAQFQSQQITKPSANATEGLTSNKTAGIGASLVEEGRYIVVQSILPDSPSAAQHDIHVGDRIIAIAQNHDPPVQVQSGNLARVIALIRGPEGTTVRLTIVPTGEDDSRAHVVSIVRGELKTRVRGPALNLPTLFRAIEQCDGVRFAEILTKDMSSVNMKVMIRKVYPDGQWENIPTTPLEYASQYGCTNIVSQLLEYEVEITPNASKLAAANGRLEVIRMLLKAKAYPFDGVEEAVENGHPDVLEALIAGGANISRMNGNGIIDLAAPVKNGNSEMVQVLLKELAKCDPQKDYHKSGTFTEAIHTAESQGKLEIAKIFVADGAIIERSDIQAAIASNQPNMLAYLRETKRAQEAEAADQIAAAEKEKADKETAVNGDINKQIKDALDHPTDAYGLADSRYREFNGKVYDCAEPITFLNKLNTFNAIYDQHPDKREFLQDAAKSNQANPWLRVANDCSLLPILIKQVTPDGLIVRLNSPRDQEVLVLLKNHPKQAKYVDGDVMATRLFVLKTSPYHYTGVLGVLQTIPAYDFGVVVPVPSSSVEKLPIPDAGP